CGTLYTYHEGHARRTPDEVCSLLLNFLRANITERTEELVLFSDGCPGQNRNNTIVRFLMSLFIEFSSVQIVSHYVAIRGHSFLPCDQDFGVIKGRIKQHDRVYEPKEYLDIMKSARREQPFDIVEVASTDVLDFKTWWP